MSRTRYKIYETEYPYFITTNIVKGFPIFSYTIAADAVLEALEFLQDERNTLLYAYVIMENHVHFIAQSPKLPKHLRAFKSWTARKIIDSFELNGQTRQLSRLRRVKRETHTDSDHQVWEEDFYPKQIIGDDMMLQKIEYIHDNPIKRGYVERPEHWRYSSARNYLGLQGLIPVTIV